MPLHTSAALAPLPIIPVTADFFDPATMSDPELQFFADGTDVMMIWDGGRKGKRGTTIGVTDGKSPYRYQRVRFFDGTESNVAPHVLHRS